MDDQVDSADDERRKLGAVAHQHGHWFKVSFDRLEKPLDAL